MTQQEAETVRDLAVRLLSEEYPEVTAITGKDDGDDWFVLVEGAGHGDIDGTHAFPTAVARIVRKAEEARDVHEGTAGSAPDEGAGVPGA